MSADRAEPEGGDRPGRPAREAILDLQSRVNQAIIGQERVVARLIAALLANGNVLIEGLPGLAKTRAIKSLAQNLEADFSRIQFTPDLLPSDVTGGEIYRSDGQGGGTFEFRQGPVFGNLVLADEINRAPAKVQSALLEAMEERQVTVAGKRYKLPDLFMVLATENPIEQEGTYPLPEAQMDRFLMHVHIDYPSDADEVKVLRLVREENAGAERFRSAAEDPAAGDLRCAQGDRPHHLRRGHRDLYGRPDRGDAPSIGIRRQAQAVDRHRRQPARFARPRPDVTGSGLASGTRLCRAGGCAGHRP